MFKIRSLVTALALISSISVASAWETLPTEAPEPADNKATEAKIELGKNALSRSPLIFYRHRVLFFLPQHHVGRRR